MGLPLPVQQSRGSLQSQCGPSVYHLSCAACSVADGALPPGAAEPRLPSVAVGAPRPIHRRKGDSPSRCSRAEAPFGSNESPSTTRSESFWLIQHRTGLPLPVQHGHGSLRSQCEPSICRLKLRCVLGGGRGFPSRCSRAAAPFGSNESPSIYRLKYSCLSSIGRVFPFRCSRATVPFGSNESPSIYRLKYSCLSSVGRGFPFRCSRATAPFGRSVGPPSAN
ncbi:hypothetical protein ROHU_019450 [Labeo rohita]|uniref:Uncharacterized protein n=1 Tax=Labeo rohita TaxID=84645 RepID=A0A498MZP3_LABRO|nr:hypothetical protein ROHU_023602 [Labeo rohita]RXN28248.1 hypothetical protein ROHU_019450 [Labeo rohita]